MNWPSFWIEAVKILGPAIIAAIVSIMISRHQYKIKVMELMGQSQLKARELLFSTYQKRSERVSEQTKDFVQQIEKLLPELKLLEEKHGKEQSLIPLLLIVKSAFDVWRDDFKDLESELKKYGLTEKWKNQLTFLNELFSIDPNEISITNIEPIYLGFMKAAGLITLLYSELLNKKSEELFSDFVLPNSDIKRLVG